MKLFLFNKKLIVLGLFYILFQTVSAQETFPRISMEGVDLVGAITWGRLDEYEQLTPGYYTFRHDDNMKPDKMNILHQATVSGGCVFHDGKIYSNEYEDDYKVHEQKPKWRIYDAETFALLSETELKDNCESTSYSLTYDPVSDKIYGFLSTYSETFLVEVNPVNGDMKRLTVLDRDCQYYALACNKKGILYCTYRDKSKEQIFLAKIRKNDGKLAIVNKMEGEDLLPGDLFVNMNYPQALFFNNSNGKLYWIFGSSSMYLCKEYTAIMEINTASAKAKQVAYIPEQFFISGAYLMEPHQKAPAVVSDFQFIPEAVGSLKGKLQFNLPDKAYDGSALQSALSVEVREGERVIVKETAESGKLFTSELLEFTNDMHEVEILVSNENGKSPVIKRKFYVGYDVPRACQNIRLVSDGLTTTLTWDPPVEGMHGAPINTEHYTYKVVRYPYEVTVAENTKERVFIEEHPQDMTRYVYAVIPYDGTRKGRSAFSNNLIVGTPLDVPYGGIFRDAADMINYYTILDSNHDRSSWSYDKNTAAAFYTFNEVNDADDWLISPPINYKKGKQYILKFKSYSWSPDYPEAMEVRFGEARTPEAQDNLLLTLSQIPAATEDSPVKEYSVDFSVDKDGVYYYSFHAISPAFSGYLFVFDIRVQEKGVGIDALHSDDLQIVVDGNNVCIYNTDNQKVEIYSVNGSEVYSSEENLIQLSVPSGVYLVKSAGGIQKMVVF